MKFNRRILMLTLCFCAVFAMMCVSASAEEETHGSHALCAGTTCTDPTHTSENHGSVNFEHKLTSDDSNNLCIDGTAVSVSSNCYELAAGNYYLASDITIGKNIQISAGNTVKICLNGRTITCNEQDAIIENRGTLDITDCKSSAGKITHGGAVEASSETRGIDNYNATLKLWNGSITGNTVKMGVSGVYNSGTFIMYGGSITQNSISSESYNSGGRGAVGNNGTFTMYGGGISGNNTADDGGGVYNYKDGSSLATFTMTGGEISNNTSAKNGGGVYNDGSFTMSGGRISNNQSKKETSATPKPGGGGVYNYGSFTMTGGEISNNTAAMNGGGVRNANGIFNMDGGIISGNKAGEEGGGVHNDSSVTFTMTAGKIEGNTAQESGGGVYSYGAFTMSGGSITKNTSNKYNGGGVYSYGAFTMSGGSITENTSNNYNGGGVYVGNALKVSGSVQITGNKKGGTFATDGKLTGGTDSNVYFSNGNTITVESDKSMDANAKVYITVSSPTNNLNVVNGTTATTGFFSDDTDYELKSNGSNGLKLALKTVSITGVTLLNHEGGSEMTGATRSKVYDGKTVAYSSGGSWTPNVSNVTLTYTWQKKTSGDTYNNITNDAAPSDVGEYRLHVEAKRSSTILGTLDLPFTITKGEGRGAVSMNGWTYGGTANSPTTTSETNTGEVTYQYKVKDATDSETEWSAEVPVNAGTYTIKAIFAETDNYNQCSATADFTISPKPLTVSVTAADKVYDGTTNATLNTGTLQGLLNADKDKVKLVSTGVTAAFTNTNAGESKPVTINGSYTLSGDAAKNYTLTQPSGITANINKASLTITGATVKPKTYDGTTNATVTGVTFGGLQSGETLEFGTDYTVTSAGYDHANATGTDEATKVTFVVTLGSSEKAGNYTLTNTTGMQTAKLARQHILIRPCQLPESVVNKMNMKYLVQTLSLAAA